MNTKSVLYMKHKNCYFCNGRKLLSTTALVTNPRRMTYVEGTITGTDVKLEMASTIIKILKEKHPTLAALAAEEGKDL
jgi:hypothetical protein